MSTKGFKPGDSIVPMSSPFLKTLSQSQKGRLCDACFKPGMLCRCDGCKAMYYCGKKCQKKDWKDGHSVECKSSVFRSPPKFEEIPGKICYPDLVPNVLRTLAKFRRDPESFSKKYPVYGTVELSFNDLIAHDSLVDNCMSDDVSLVFLFLVLLFNQLKDDKSFRLNDSDKEFLIRIFGVWKTHGIEIRNEDQTFKIGVGVYIPHSAIKHACRPNAIKVYKVDLMEIRCIHPIPEGEAPLISNLAGNRNYDERKAVLLSRFNFLCACDLCKAEIDGPLIDYGELQSLEDQLRFFNEINYKDATVIRDGALKHFRKLYHEYDERITNFFALHFDILLLWQESFHNVSVKYLQNDAKDVEIRMRITFGEQSFDYLEFQEKATKAGLELENSAEK